MSTTTIRLTPELRSRLDTLAAGAGLSTHAFMLETLSSTALQMEQQQAFDAEAERRWRRFQRTREVISLDDLSAYASGLLAGKKPPRPKASKLPPEPPVAAPKARRAA
jgi:predicted transcriptional regulator